ncbi:hypothetical protein [uncultured Litoreibacter sp.]|uniref:hypothetical protein n=1 Tax=uncultured Litoreibacter sp. TaxID=1392394 RepID=UPI002606FD54|nr:hypothetical protein [uncultured Litoreibacter sp.]
MTILYTPGQLRGAISLSPETYRHWKKALGPLQCARGHSPCFKPGDLVALSIVKALTQELGIRVKALAPIAGALFDLCNESPWPVLERAKVVIDLPGENLQLLGERSDFMSDSPVITVSLAPVIAHLREQLLTATDEDEQKSLRFPPVKVTQGARS